MQKWWCLGQGTIGQIRISQKKVQYQGVEIYMTFRVSALYQQSLVIGSYAKCRCVGYYRIDKNKTRTIPVPRSRNINDVSGLYHLQQLLVIESYLKMLARRVLSDRYRTKQEKFQYQGVEIYMTFRVSTIYNSYQLQKAM